MKKKEIPLHTSREVAESLSGIEEATLDEEFERRRRGLAQEPEVKIVERKNPDPGIELVPDIGPKGKWSKEDVKDSAIKWQEKNLDYCFKEVEPDETEIIDNSSINFPLEFVDHLIGVARTMISRKKLVLFGKVEQVKIKPISDQPDVISLMIKDDRGNSVILNFHARPPFDLKETSSTLGVNYFAK